jgi:hypothetical protein
MNIKGTLLRDYAKDEGILGQYVVLNRNLTSDGLGGQEYTIVEGLTFEGVLILNTSIEGQIAQKQGVTGIYTFAYPKNLTIPPKTILRRVKDGKIFRTTDIDGVPTPDMSTLDMKVTRLEDYTLPANDVE